MSNVTPYAYDAWNRLVTLTQADPDGGAGPLPTEIIHPDTTSRTLTYNDFGQMTHVVDKNNNDTWFEYDLTGRRLVARDDQNHEVTFGYDDQCQRYRSAWKSDPS